MYEVQFGGKSTPSTPVVRETEAKPAKRVQLQGNTQLQAGVVNTVANETYSDIGLKLNGQLKINDKTGFTHLGASFGAGTARSAEIELGHEFNIGKNMGLDISGKAGINASNATFSAMSTAKTDVYNEYQGTAMCPEGHLTDYTMGVYSSETGIVASNWHPGETRLAGSVKFNYKPSWGKLSAGVEAGVKNNLNGEAQTISKGNASVEIPGSPKKVYVTPTVAAEVNMSKNGKFAAFADADLKQVHIGARLKF